MLWALVGRTPKFNKRAARLHSVALFLYITKVFVDTYINAANSAPQTFRCKGEESIKRKLLQLAAIN
jgi:hypothetical protein